MALPIKTTIEDFEALGGYLKSQVGWVAVSKIKGTIDKKHADNRKLEAGRYIGFIERDGTNIRLTTRGRAYATATDETSKANLMLEMLLSAELYRDTVHWLHFSKKTDPTRTEIGIYWHDHHSSKLDGAQGDAVTDAAVFFIRIAGAAGLGQFISAGKGRPETYLKGDAAAIERAAGIKVEDAEGKSDASTDGTQPPAAEVTREEASPPPPPPAPPTKNVVSTSPAVHVNIEIHIAADATASTVAEIFKNMRKYVLNDAPAEDGE